MEEKVKKLYMCVITLFIMMFMCVGVSAATLMKSKDVIFDNKNTGIDATNVQEAVDELYSAATDYSSLASRVTALETSSFLNSHPVGSIYVTVSDKEDTIEKMHNLYGGTWEKYGEGRTIISSGTNTDSNGNVTTYMVGNTGGNTGVTLTTANLPSHNHSFTPSGTNSYTTSTVTTGNQSANHTHSGTTASSGAHEHNVTNYGGTYLYSQEDSATYPGEAGMKYTWTYTTTYPLKTNNTGNHTHTFTTGNNSANHTHSITAANLKTAIGTITFTGTAATTGNTGSASQLNIQNPYIVVYMYKRVS